jgi:hypothetical protein
LHWVESAWHEHGPFAFWLVEALRPGTLVELGTHTGFSYLAFCQAVQRLGLPTACYAIDTWKGDDHAGFYGEEVFCTLNATNERYYSGFSRLVRGLFDEALPYFKDGTVDLLHIDGRHGYEDVQHDFLTWRQKLSERAVVVFHDTNVREREFGVWRFWDELAAENPSFEFVHGQGLGVLAVGRVIPEGVRALFECSSIERLAIRDSYARLGAAISRQYQLDLAHIRAETSATDVERLLAEVAACGGEIERLGTRSAAREAELERLRAEGVAREGELAKARARTAQAEQLADRLAQERAEQAKELVRLDEELSEMSRNAEAMRETVANLTDSVSRTRQELQLIQGSTFWRATAPLRRGLDRLPVPVHRSLRRGVKVLYWALTPHRIPERLATLRSRKHAGFGEVTERTVDTTIERNGAL